MPDADDEAAAELRELYLRRQKFLPGMYDTTSRVGTDPWAVASGHYYETLMQICRRHGVDVPWTLHGLLSVDQRRYVEGQGWRQQDSTSGGRRDDACRGEATRSERARAPRPPTASDPSVV